LGEDAVEGRDIVLEGSDTTIGGRPAGLEIEQVLDGSGDAVQRRERVSGHYCGFSFFRFCPRSIKVSENQSIEAWIAPLDTGDGFVHDLDGRHLLCADAARGFSSSSKGGVAHRISSRTSRP